MEFTTNSSARTPRFQRVCTPEVEEEREKVVGNPNGVVYAVTVKTDVEIIVGNLLRQISAAFSLFLRWSGTIVCEVLAWGERQQIGQKEA